MRQIQDQGKATGLQPCYAPTRAEILASFQQACETARHYSMVRFVMFTVFTTILGALLLVEIRPDFWLDHGAPVVIYRLTSMTLALLFISAERRVSKLVGFYQERAAHDFRPHVSLPLLGDHEQYVVFVRYIMTAPLFAALVFWLYRLVAYGADWPSKPVLAP